MPGGQGGTDIWMCHREGEGWSSAINLGPTVNTSEKEMFPTICNDSVLYFASDGHPGYGALDIFKTKTKNGIWTTPENLQPPINSSFDDFAIAFAPGEESGFFSSNRPEGMGSDDIYAFRMAKPAPVVLHYISGLVKDKTNMQPMAGATVFLYEPASGKVRVLKTDKAGMYKAMIDKPAEYMVKAMMPEYISDCSLITVSELKPGSPVITPRDLLLDKLSINKSFRIDNIYYDFDKYAIRADAKAELDKLVRIMKDNPVNVELGSHTDSRGTADYNDKLSQKRADAAVKYIINSGIDKSRIIAKGYGERQLVNKCADGVACTAAEHQANRRTEFKVTSLNSTVVNPDQFDPGIYNEGQELYSKMLPPDFFVNCK
jgi:outer membrane protein OmpA-like peptidoglycan-associated protein